MDQLVVRCFEIGMSGLACFVQVIPTAREVSCFGSFILVSFGLPVRA